MKKIQGIYEVIERDLYKIFVYEPRGGLIVSKQLLRIDDDQDVLEFPLIDASCHLKVIDGLQSIIIRKDEPEELSPDPFGVTYCFESPTNIWFKYNGCSANAPLFIKQVFTRLFVPDNISHNDPGRMNWFISTLGIGPWKILAVSKNDSGKLETNELVIPAYTGDEMTQDWKDFRKALKTLNITMTKRLRFE